VVPMVRSQTGWLIIAVAAATVSSCAPKSCPELDAELEAIRRKGGPLSFSEWRRPAVPDDENAAPVYRAAFVRMREAPKEERRLLGNTLNKPFSTVSDAEWAAVRRHIDRNRDALALIRKAAAMPKCRFALDLEKGYALQVPHLAKLREAGRLLQWQAIMLAKDGRSDDALRACIDCTCLSAAVADEPLLNTSQVSRMAFGKEGVALLEAILPRIKPGVEACGDALKRLRGLECRETITKAIEAERAKMVEFLGKLRSDRSSVQSQVTALVGVETGLFPTPQDCADEKRRARAMLAFAESREGMVAEAACLKYFAELLALSRKPFHEYRATWPAFRERSHALWNSNRVAALLDIGIAVGHLGDQADWEATCRLARVALALTAYRRQHGTYPESLDALVPSVLKAVPCDPFTGQAPVYRQKGDGLLVYCVGENGVDDGGMSERERRWKPPKDVVFRFDP